MRPISNDLRKRVIDASIEGASMGKIAARFNIPRSSVQNLIRHFRSTGKIEPKPSNSGRKPAFSPEALCQLREYVFAHPGATLAELRRQSGLDISLVAVHNTLRKKLGFTRKKSRYMP